MNRASTTVTVVFTDLVGSTELLRESPQAADEIQRTHREAAHDAVEHHRGTVVKDVGDGVMAVFASAVDAVGCAEAIQQAADRARRRDSRHPLVRVGLSTGEAIHDGNDWHGRPVVEASRLCTGEASAGDQVLATAVVAMMLGGSGAHTFAPLGKLELKGFDEPVEVFELAWRRTSQSSIPLPAPAGARRGISLRRTGRRVRAAHEPVGAGRSRRLLRRTRGRRTRHGQDPAHWRAGAARARRRRDRVVGWLRGRARGPLPALRRRPASLARARSRHRRAGF